jgi:hypothetical protein
LDNGSSLRLKDTGFIYGLLVISMKENGKIALNMDRELNSLLMGTFSLAHTSTENQMAKDLTSGQMGHLTRVTLWTD